MALKRVKGTLVLDVSEKTGKISKVFAEHKSAASGALVDTVELAIVKPAPKKKQGE